MLGERVRENRYALLSLGIAALLVVMTSLGGWTWLGSWAIAQVGQEHYLVANTELD